MAEKELGKQKQFLAEIEKGIRAVNQEVIHQRIPPITWENLLPLAVSVARLRARYLEAAFRLAGKVGGEPFDDTDIDALRRQRQMYEEARCATRSSAATWKPARRETRRRHARPSPQPGAIGSTRDGVTRWGQVLH